MPEIKVTPLGKNYVICTYIFLFCDHCDLCSDCFSTSTQTPEFLTLLLSVNTELGLKFQTDSE